MMTVELKVNGHLVDVYAAINRGHATSDSESDVRLYEIQDSARCIIGVIRHARGDGAVELARAVLQYVRDQGEA